MPVLSAIGRAEQGGVFNPGVNDLGIAQRWFQVPHTFELPRVLRAVVPLVRRERLTGLGGSVVDELVALGFGHALWGRGQLTGRCPGLMPCFAGVIGTLDDLPEPAAGL